MMELLWDCVKAFLVGGMICAIGQLLLDYTKMTPARILCTFVVLGASLGAVGLYRPLAEWAGCGATVPLTGFGYLLVQGVKDAVEKDGFLGILTGGFSSAAGGITTAVFLSVAAAFCFKPHDKNR